MGTNQEVERDQGKWMVIIAFFHTCGYVKSYPVISVAGGFTSSVRQKSGTNLGVVTRMTVENVRAKAPAVASQVWLWLGSQAVMEEVLPTSGIYVRAGDSPVTTRLAKQIQHWEFMDVVDLLPEVKPL